MEEPELHKILSEFLYNNSDLERLEALADEFNIFSALGIINNEIRHSNFLGWLMDPQESHGLGDYYLRSFLKSVVYNNENDLNSIAPTIFEIDEFDFSKAEVLREWKNIDVLVRDDQNEFVCIIENKIQSKEHSNQLRRYRDLIESEFSNYSKIYIYLTVEKEIPSDDTYIPISYSDVIFSVNQLIENKQDKANDELISFISHYVEMVKRFIMKESEIQQICKRIYKNHKKALDLIFENKPDQQEDIYFILKEIIQKDPDLIWEDSSKSYIRFFPKALDHVIPKVGKGWVKSKRLLIFEIKNHTQGIDVYLIIGPGNPIARQKIYDASINDKSVFNKVTDTLYGKWNSIYKKRILSSKKYEDKELSEFEGLIREKFNDFKNKDLKVIVEKLTDLDFTDISSH